MFAAFDALRDGPRTNIDILNSFEGGLVVEEDAPMNLGRYVEASLINKTASICAALGLLTMEDSNESHETISIKIKPTTPQKRDQKQKERETASPLYEAAKILLSTAGISNYLLAPGQIEEIEDSNIYHLELPETKNFYEAIPYYVGPLTPEEREQEQKRVNELNLVYKAVEIMLSTAGISKYLLAPWQMQLIEDHIPYRLELTPAGKELAKVIPPIYENLHDEWERAERISNGLEDRALGNTRTSEDLRQVYFHLWQGDRCTLESIFGVMPGNSDVSVKNRYHDLWLYRELGFINNDYLYEDGIPIKATPLGIDYAYALADAREIAAETHDARLKLPWVRAEDRFRRFGL